MTTHTNPFNQPKAGGDTATTDSRIEAIEREIRALGHELRSHNELHNMDEVVRLTSLARHLRDLTNHVYNAGRASLWRSYGPGKHATESGRTFSFTKPATSRKSCNYEVLAKYPSAYEAAVTVTPTKADAVGTLKFK